MNIFKTLASGSGSINEPNISAFLGYLLNPKEDHGLGDAFLKRFLKPLFDKKDSKLNEMKGRDLSIRSNFEFEVLLEQAFENDNNKDDNSAKNRIVDIVILCYEKKSQPGKSLAKDIINQKIEGQDKPNHIFLIENKIKDGSVEDRQLEEQYNQTIGKLREMKIDDPEELISVIFVTPEDTKAKTEFKNFVKSDNNKTDNKCHLFWHTKETKKDDTSISKIIKNIIQREYPPIDAYCKYTLQAFLEFIESGFQSSIKDELKEKKKGSFNYNGDTYSRPQLAERIIRDYIQNNPNKTYKELKHEFSSITTGKYFPFLEKDEAQTFNSKRSANWYYNNPIPIADVEICVLNDWTDEKKLQKLLEKVMPGVILDKIRAK